MRVLCTVFAMLFVGGVATAQAPQPYGNLLLVMRSILFPNSNIIFNAASDDPAAEKADKQNIYVGWPRVESAAVALAESANLISMPKRLCANGKPVPVARPDWVKFTQGLVEAGRTALKAAQAKNMDAILEAGDAVAEACAACHEVYRDKGTTEATRCE